MRRNGCLQKGVFGESVSSLPHSGLLIKKKKKPENLSGQRRNGLSKNTLLDNRFSARHLLRSFGAPPQKKKLGQKVPNPVFFFVSQFCQCFAYFGVWGFLLFCRGSCCSQVPRNYHAICARMGHRKDVPVRN